MQKTRCGRGQSGARQGRAEKGAKRTAIGLVITTIKEGTGASPEATDTVKVHYHGTLPNGEGVRQLAHARRAGRVPARWRNQVLDRRRAR
jgi:hypothetical protein